MNIIDIHTHGIGGYDTRTTSEEDILRIAETHGSFGVSEILLTLYPSPIAEMRAQMETIRRAMERQKSTGTLKGRKVRNTSHTATNRRARKQSSAIRAATIAGLYLEGPFLNPSQAGALDADAFLPPSEYAFMKLVDGFEDIIKIMAIAPELPGAVALIREAVGMGIVVSMGHSDATFDEAQRGFRAGAMGITHLFNAMRGIHHRELGIAGFGLMNKHVYCEIIADPYHLHDLAIDLVLSVKTPDKIILVSDSVRETISGTRRGGIRDVYGTLRGGSMTLTECARRLLRRGFDPDMITRCVTENPRMYLAHGRR